MKTRCSLQRVACSGLLGRRLDKVDEISTGVLEDYGGDWPHFHRLATKLDSTCFEAIEFGSNVFRDECGSWDSSFKQSLLIRAGRRKGHWLQNELDACHSLGRGNREPTERSHGYVRLLLEAEHGRVEAESDILVLTMMPASVICMDTSQFIAAA